MSNSEDKPIRSVRLGLLGCGVVGGGLIKLIESRYEGWLVVEQDETRRQPTESARMSRDYLKEQFGL